jgi:hypothetical protein
MHHRARRQAPSGVDRSRPIEEGMQIDEIQSLLSGATTPTTGAAQPAPQLQSPPDSPSALLLQAQLGL